MLPIDLETRADVVILPSKPGGEASLPCRDISVASAIRYVVEELSACESLFEWGCVADPYLIPQ